MISLVLGGARSGKSHVAEQLVASAGAEIVYVATARPWENDSDFAARIDLHRRRRPQHWRTEDQLDAVEVLLAPPTADGIIVDDLGTWLTEQFNCAQAWPGQSGDRSEVDARCIQLVDALISWPQSRNLVIVSPEVGMGVIPESAAGRVFRDALGNLNSRVAEVADSVSLIVAGCTLTLKG